MLKVLVGDITKCQDIDVIVNAANGIAVMGAGVAGAIARTGGEMLKTSVKKAYLDNKKPFEEGEVYISEPGLLKRRFIKHIYHAVVMKFPGSPTSIDIVSRALKEALNIAMKNKMRSIAIPGMGTGIGKLDKKMVAGRMARIIRGYEDSIDITVIDTDEEFIRAFRESVLVGIFEKNKEV